MLKERLNKRKQTGRVRIMIWDVIVIGAGPASAAFARRAALGGINVLVIDGQTETNKKPCGGLLAPDAQKILAGSDFVFRERFWLTRKFLQWKPWICAPDR